MEPNGVANLCLRDERSCKHVNNLVSCVLVICLVPNLIDQHDVAGLKFHVLQLIHVFVRKFYIEWVNPVNLVKRFLPGLLEIIVVGEVGSIISNPCANLV